MSSILAPASDDAELDPTHFSPSDDESDFDSASERRNEQILEYRVKRLPKRCGVSDQSIQDPMLAEHYLGLPNLVPCHLYSWASSLRGLGQVLFSHWAEQCPDMSLEFCLSIVNFVNFGRFVNPSRADPRITTALKVTPEGRRWQLMIDAEPAILISTIYCTQSHLLSPPARGLYRKSISGISHCQEWERQMSFIGMAFGHRALLAQLLSDAMTYSTLTAYRGPNLLQPPPTATIHSATALQVFDQVPVYDATFTTFDPNNDWADLDMVLPPFMSEVPYGSCVAVGYTCDCYLIGEEWRLSTNVRFAVVLGIS